MKKTIIICITIFLSVLISNLSLIYCNSIDRYQFIVDDTKRYIFDTKTCDIYYTTANSIKKINDVTYSMDWVKYVFPTNDSNITIISPSQK